MTVEVLIFGALALIMIAAAVLMILTRNAVHSALWLVLNFVAIAVIYLILG